MDCVREIGGAKLFAERDREWPERGDVVRGRYGMDDKADGAQDGEDGEVGLGSVLRRIVGGLRMMLPRSRLAVGAGKLAGLLRRREGTGEGSNLSIRSVSGTGSMIAAARRPGHPPRDAWEWSCAGEWCQEPAASNLWCLLCTSS